MASIGKNRELGKNKELLWHIHEDFARMKKITMGHPIIMGRKTFESIGRPLPERTNIVVSRHPSEIQGSDGVAIVNSLDEAIEFAKNSPGSEEIFIFGGGQIFKEALEKDLVGKLYLTVIEDEKEADTYFPEYSKFDKVVSEQEGEENGLKYKFLEIEKG